MKALDLFCGGGGASLGLSAAGYEVTGVDNKPHKRYPFRFYLADALTFPLDGYDLIWASPPCQEYSKLRALHPDHHYPDLIDAIRWRLYATGVPFIIENVPGAPLLNHITLCGATFGLRTYRHRWFESNVLLLAPPHAKHTIKASGTKGNHRNRDGMLTVTGNNISKKYCSLALGIPYDAMTQKEMTQAIPPVYAEYLARQIGGNL